MLLKNFVTVSFGLLLSLKAMADDKGVYSAKLTCAETDKKAPSAVKTGYQVNTGYRIDDFHSFSAAAIDPMKPQSKIFSAKVDPRNVQHMDDSPSDSKYAFSAELELIRGL
ncbi:hypothetical protein [Pseudomonas sp. GM55]|jgi:hypothetical protein|uniref:hypothetical protein n=1 Tax=Pseudomonas sp. GM55 TaxID=1144333 RepID=UPI0002708043|nr:hypothetical protein [Pseudomonas sp. GM55]EJM64967.1 hypothetical protein PMI31_05936 [Pseudomonas sp. GM55]